MVPTPTRSLRPVTYVWVNAAQGKSSHLRIYSAQSSQQISLKELGTITLSSCGVVAVVFVPGPEELVMVATDDRRILFYSASEPERGCELGRLVVPGDIASLVQHCGQMWVGLQTGSLVILRQREGSWEQAQALNTLLLGAEPVSVLVPSTTNCLLASCGRRVMMLDLAGQISRSFTLAQDCPDSGLSNIAHMAVAGVGLWVNLANEYQCEYQQAGPGPEQDHRGGARPAGGGQAGERAESPGPPSPRVSSAGGPEEGPGAPEEQQDFAPGLLAQSARGRGGRQRVRPVRRPPERAGLRVRQHGPRPGLPGEPQVRPRAGHHSVQSLHPGPASDHEVPETALAGLVLLVRVQP